MKFVLFCCFDPGHGNHYQVARMSMISVFVCYFFLTKLFLCLFILFLLMPRLVPVVKTSSAPEVLPEIVQVDDSFSPGAVDRSRSSGGAPSRRRLFLSFSLAHRPRSVAEVLRDTDRPSQRILFLLVPSRPRPRSLQR